MEDDIIGGNLTPAERIKDTLSRILTGGELKTCNKLIDAGQWRKLTEYADHLDAMVGQDFVDDIEEIASRTRFNPWRFRRLVLERRNSASQVLIANICYAGAVLAEGLSGGIDNK